MSVKTRYSIDIKKQHSSAGSSSPGEYEGPHNYGNHSKGTGLNYGESDDLSRPWTQRVIDSFKPDPRYEKGLANRPVGGGRGVWNPHTAAVNTACSPLARKLKGRHLQMIAIGGSIGTGLFVASGKALHAGGPASLLIAFCLIGIMLYCTVHALGEMAVIFPVAGSFSAFSTRLIDPAWGFAMGWNYAMQWMVVLPLEVIAASITINYWNDTIPHSIFVAIFLMIIIGVNLIGVKGFGEAEFTFSIVKVIAVIGFILLGIIINCGGGVNNGYIGGRYWRNPGAFNNGFKGLCSVFVTAAFSFAGTELVGLAAAETENPRKSLPKAIKQVFWRITLFYIVSLTVVGLLVSYEDPRLLSGKGSVDIAASPFVIAIEDAGITVLPSIMNVVILIAVLSVGNSSIFGSSRTLAALADQGQAPKIFAYVDRKGRPLNAIIAASSLGFIAFAADSSKAQEVLDWLVALSGLSNILTWASINLAHIRFRRAWRVQGRELDDLAFRSQTGVVGSWIGFSFNIVILAAQFWSGVFPEGYRQLTVAGQVKNFFLSFLALPVVLMFYLYWKIYKRTGIVRSKDVDLVSGQREMDVAVLLKKEREDRAYWPTWRRAYNMIC